MLEFGDIITLENNKEYVVASTCNYKNDFFAYIVNINNSQDCVLGKIINEDFQIIQDINIFVEVMPLIFDNIDESIWNGDEGDDE